MLGPTGAGKSELALVLAESFDGEIINCDSIQVYRRLEIGCAKVAPENRRGVPHHMIDIIDPDEELTAGAYARLAREAISRVRKNGHLAIVVGGTGFYLRALLEGLSPAPARNEELRVRLRDLAGRRPGSLHRFLRKYDPEAAMRIHPNDHQKLIRAIEMTCLARQPVTTTQSLPRDRMEGTATLKIGLKPDRSALYERLNDRSAWMFESGLLTEAKSLLDSGLSPESKPLQSLGYKQAVQVLKGQSRLEEAIRECQTKTRQYAKRQMTWFRREPEVSWLAGFGTEEAIQIVARERVNQFLGTRSAWFSGSLPVTD